MELGKEDRQEAAKVLRRLANEIEDGKVELVVWRGQCYADFSKPVMLEIGFIDKEAVEKYV